MLTMERRGQLPEELQLDLKKKTLPHLLEDAALHFPGEIAISTPHTSISFQSLNDKATLLARHIIAKGIQHQSRIAVFANPGPDMVIAMFGIWKAGGVYVPIDPLMQKQTISKILTQTKPNLLLSSISPVPGYLQDEVPSFSLQQLLAAPLSDDIPPLEIAATPQNAAYTVLSEENEIELNHMGVVNLVFWYRSRHSFSSKDTAALLARPCSDLSIVETTAALCNGACVKFPLGDTLGNAKSLMNWIEQERISLIYLQVPLTETLLQQAWPKETSLRIMFTGGDQLKKHPQKPLPFTLINNYGPAENTIISTEYAVNCDEESLVIPIGQPISNVKAYVLDKTMQEVSHGSAGQLCLGGIGLARGYIHDNEMNQKRFIVHTQLGKRPERLFLTGDLVRKRNDGKLEYLGKIDEQEALGDDKIGISAVESILNSHPAIHHAVVKLVELSGEQVLVAYWVQAEGIHASKQDLKRTLKKRLPPHMVPKRFIQLNQIPTGASGKICYRQLPVQQLEEEGAEEDDIPHNPIEKQLQAIFKEEMNLSSAGVCKTLFDLKASSAQVKRLLLRINQHFGKSYSLAHLLKHDSIGKMAELIITPPCQEPNQELIELQKNGSSPPLFCVHGFEGDIYPYYLLSKFLGNDYPVFVLPAEEDDDSVEKMAEDYAAKILKARPSGKLNLLGFSIGSYVAFEMARIFKEKNKGIAFVGIIDTYAPHFPQKHALLKRLQINASQFFALTTQEKKDFLITRWQQLEQKTTNIFRIKNDNEGEIITKSLKAIFQKAMTAYSPASCEIPLTVIIAQDETDQYRSDPSLGWKDYTINLKIEKAPGTSKEILEIPGIKQLAQIIKKQIDDSSSHS